MPIVPVTIHNPLTRNTDRNPDTHVETFW
jgi:hypothetical protein